jgi:LysR family glycine cleavage system transcriptional activator
MSSAAIDGRGFVLAQLLMAADDITSGRLVVPFDIRLLSQPYALAWDPGVLDKPFGPELRGWIQSIARRQRAVSSPSG